MTRTIRCTWPLAALVVLIMSAPAWAQGVGSGTLTVTGGVDFDDPNHWDVYQGQILHLNISPGFKTCTTGGNLNDRCSGDTDCNVAGICSGPPTGKTCSANSPVNAGGACSTATDCSYIAPVNTCALGLECSGDTTVYIKGKDGNACTQDSECIVPGETGCDTGAGLCKVVDTVTTSGRSGNGPIDVDYTTNATACSTATVAYCTIGTLANVNLGGTQVFIPSDLRSVDSTDVPIETPGKCAAIPTCTNTEGSLCCTLTQGAYGAPNSVATAAGTGVCNDLINPLTGAGFIPAAICAGVNPFTGDPDGTTVGLHPTRSVTANNLTALIGYLPTGSTAGSLKSSTSDKHYTGGPYDSKGDGGGVLTGQTMACQLNDFLSDNGFTPGGVTGNLGAFVVTSSFCTARSGTDKVVGTGDDITNTFTFPACAVGKTVQQILDAANALLGGVSNSLGCSAADLNNALSNINVMFDQCGKVVSCLY
jgi:hypothetical protein